MLLGAQHVPGHVTGHDGHNGEGHRHSAFKFHCPVKIEVISISSCRWLSIEISQGDDLEDDEDELILRMMTCCKDTAHHCHACLRRSNRSEQKSYKSK